MHLDNELETTEIIQAAFKDRKRVFLPRISKLDGSFKAFESQKTHLEMLEIPSFAVAMQLESRGKFKIREPTVGTNCLDAGGIDCLILPAVAYTEHGDRLGHGAGFYDSFISEHYDKIGKLPVLVGIGLEQQLLDSIPTEEHDVRMDVVVVSNSTFRR